VVNVSWSALEQRFANSVFFSRGAFHHLNFFQSGAPSVFFYFCHSRVGRVNSEIRLGQMTDGEKGKDVVMVYV